MSSPAELSFEDLLSDPYGQWDLDGELLPDLVAFTPAQPIRQRSAKRQDRERRKIVNQALGHPAKKRGDTGE